MRLYVVRHAEARPKSEDPERHLTTRGETDARRVAALLRPLELQVDQLWHSTKARARQTAELLAEAMSVGSMTERDDLGPNDDVRPIVKELKRRDAGDVMIVGHMPFCSLLASDLLVSSAEADIVGFRTVTVACLERDDEGGAWRVAWVVSPELCA